jgi:hypothetical protein
VSISDFNAIRARYVPAAAANRHEADARRLFAALAAAADVLADASCNACSEWAAKEMLKGCKAERAVLVSVNNANQPI